MKDNKIYYVDKIFERIQQFNLLAQYCAEAKKLKFSWRIKMKIKYWNLTAGPASPKSPGSPFSPCSPKAPCKKKKKKTKKKKKIIKKKKNK